MTDPNRSGERLGDDQPTAEEKESSLYQDRRGGQFFIVNGARVHESDLAKEQLELSPAPPAAEE